MLLGSKLMTSVGSDGGFVGLGDSCTRPFNQASRSEGSGVTVMGTLYPHVIDAILAARYGSVVPMPVSNLRFNILQRRRY